MWEQGIDVMCSDHVGCSMTKNLLNSFRERNPLGDSPADVAIAMYKDRDLSTYESILNERSSTTRTIH